MRICITIAGKVHCFNIPLLVDLSQIHPPHPGNYPELELAATVLELVKVAPGSELSKQLTEAAHGFISQVKQQLPKGVEMGAKM